MGDQKKQSVRYLQLTERTIKLHRNLLLVSLGAIVIQAFDLRIEKISAGGFELSNFSGTVLKSLLLIVIAYHVVAYGCMIYEEFAQWRLTFRDSERMYLSENGPEMSLPEELLRHVKELRDNPMRLETKVSAGQPDPFNEILKGLAEYRSHFSSFSKGALIRFWAIEIVVPYGAAIVAVVSLFGYGIDQLRWLRDVLASGLS